MTALAGAAREKYRAIIDAGFLIQLDDPAATSLWGRCSPARNGWTTGAAALADRRWTAERLTG